MGFGPGFLSAPSSDSQSRRRRCGTDFLANADWAVCNYYALCIYHFRCGLDTIDAAAGLTQPPEGGLADGCRASLAHTEDPRGLRKRTDRQAAVATVLGGHRDLGPVGADETDESRPAGCSRCRPAGAVGHGEDRDRWDSPDFPREDADLPHTGLDGDAWSGVAELGTVGDCR